MTLILGIETSCDETAAAVVKDGREIRSNVVSSQIALHAQYGGVYPEMASREHVLKIVPVVERALREGGASWKELDAIAVTYGPGLAGSLLVGVNFAKGLALANDVPLLGINHLEGHIYASWLAAGEGSAAAMVPEFPLLCLIVSGGHTELIMMRGHGQYEQLGSTRDDAAGEAFDKVARLLGLGYPGGPAIQKAAEEAQAGERNASGVAHPVDAERFDRPVEDDALSGRRLPAAHTPMRRAGSPLLGGRRLPAAHTRMGRAGPIRKNSRGSKPRDDELRLPRAWLEGTHDFSFSGLKTAVLNRVQHEGLDGEPSDPGQTADRAARKAQIAYAFQEAVVDVLVEKTRMAAEQYSVRMVVVGGGVAANQRLREQMRARIAVPVLIPPIGLCTDNGAVIAAAGHYRFSAGERSGWDLDVVPGLRLAAS